MKQINVIFKTSLLIIFIGICNLSFGKNIKKFETDTITNWQLYQDSKLILKSNIFDSNRFTVKIKKSQITSSLNLSVFYDFNNEIISKKIELICNGKILTKIETTENSRKKFKIPKTKIDKALIGYLNKEIYLKYFDKFNPNGMIIGILIFIDDK